MARVFTVVTFTNTQLSTACGQCTGSVTFTGHGGFTDSPGYYYSLDGTNWIFFLSSFTLSDLCEAGFSILLTYADGRTYSDDFQSFQVSIPCIDSTLSVVALVSITPLCPNTCTGEISLIITNPIGTPIISWTGTGGFTANTEVISNLCPGIYTYIVTAGGIVTGSTEILGGVFPITTTETIVNTSCNNNCDGDISVVQTGSGPFRNLWDDGSTGTTRANLCAGTYHLTVWSQRLTMAPPYPDLCRKDYYYVVTSPSLLYLTLSGNNPSTCDTNDGSIISTVSGGTSPYTYDWTGPDGFTSTVANPNGLAPGEYGVLITDDSGCSTSNKTTLYCFTEQQDILIRAKCCYADLAYKLTNFEQLGLPDTECINKKVQYLRLAICLLEKYSNTVNNPEVPEVCTDIDSTLINTLIENIKSICPSCCNCDFNDLYLDQL